MLDNCLSIRYNDFTNLNMLKQERLNYATI